MKDPELRAYSIIYSYEPNRTDNTELLHMPLVMRWASSRHSRSGKAGDGSAGDGSVGRATDSELLPRPVQNTDGWHHSASEALATEKQPVRNRLSNEASWKWQDQEFEIALKQHRMWLDGGGGGGKWSTTVGSTRIPYGLYTGVRVEAGKQANFHLRNLESRPLRGAALPFAHLSAVRCENADLAGAWLQGSLLIDSYFSGSSFVGADLRGADLSRGDFLACDFTNALLEDADLEDADFTGATFVGAHVHGILRPGTTIDERALQEANFESIGNSSVSSSPVRMAVAMPVSTEAVEIAEGTEALRGSPSTTEATAATMAAEARPPFVPLVVTAEVVMTDARGDEPQLRRVDSTTAMMNALANDDDAHHAELARDWVKMGGLTPLVAWLSKAAEIARAKELIAGEWDDLVNRQEEEAMLDREQVHIALQAVMMLSRNKEYMQAITDAGAVEPLIILARTGSEEHMVTVKTILHTLLPLQYEST